MHPLAPWLLALTMFHCDKTNRGRRPLAYHVPDISFPQSSWLTQKKETIMDFRKHWAWIFFSSTTFERTLGLCWIFMRAFLFLYFSFSVFS